jgi:hypothetical protein
VFVSTRSFSLRKAHCRHYVQHLASYPRNPKIIHQGRLVAGAAFIIALLRGEIESSDRKRKIAIEGITTALLSVEQVAECLIDRAPLLGSFQEVFEYESGKFAHVSKMVEFFVRCSADRRPSVNKALFMISEGAFGDVIDDEEVEEGDETGAMLSPPSPATLKKSWSEFAPQGPFLFAAKYLKWKAIEYLAPDDMATVSEAIRLLEDVKQVRRFFGFARYIQELLISRLDPQSMHRFKFVNLPDDIQPWPMELQPLEADKLETLARYRAPKFLPAEPKSDRR